MGLVEKGTFRKPGLKPLTWLLNYSRKYSLWVYQWGLACCAIEMGAAFGSPRYDVMRLGVIPFPAGPRQAERHRPHARLARPVHRLLDRRRDDALFKATF